ncbi:M56 family metallopeptidase [Spirosoma sp. 209]|uniref:M56 family metallopeptidase n=1 Tax=Spirosoma sp. 209 TaxID=1955701 RepID=UPI00098D012C|nr:M56 family metallopeptidase [Spirosoma sp. 209]
MNALPYFLTASLFLILFYGCYWLLLRRNTFFGLNRAYLLASVALSLTLPLISLPDSWLMGADSPAVMESVTLPAFSVRPDTPDTLYGLTADQWFWLVYGLGVLAMLTRLLMHLRAVFQLIRSGVAQARNGYTLVRLPEHTGLAGPHPSFSFGRYLVLNHADALTEPSALMRHEEAHIAQRHTVDVLFLEIVRAAFWFNPILWFYKRALQVVHEFLADRAASERTAEAPATLQADYARALVAYALDVTPTALTTPFASASTLKQRILMLQKSHSSRRALFGYVLVLPLAALLSLCTQPDHSPAVERANARPIEGEVFTVVEQPPVFPGGMEKLSVYLGEHLTYPAAARKAKATGRVFVSFVVTKTGDITDVNVLKGIGYGADEEAMRVVAEMPRWEPARQNGQPVNLKFNLPINFQLNDTPTPSAGKTEPYAGIRYFIVDGKEVTKAELEAIPPATIVRMDVNKEQGTIAITTKK